EVLMNDIMAVLKRCLPAQENPADYGAGSDVFKILFDRSVRELEDHPVLAEKYDRVLAYYASSPHEIRDRDSRIKYADLLLFLYSNITEVVKQNQMAPGRKDLCDLSIGHMLFVKSSLNMINFSAFQPFLPNGVGLQPSSLLSTEASVDLVFRINSKLVEDTDFQKKMLHHTLVTILDLIDVVDQVNDVFIDTRLMDLISIAEVLNHLGDSSLNGRYNGFLKTRTVGQRLNCFDRLNRATLPVGDHNKWFSMTMGSRTTELLTEDDALTSLLHNYNRIRNEEGGSPLVDDLPFLTKLGRVIAIPPGTMPKDEFFAKIVAQFRIFVSNPSHPYKKLGIRLFSSFIDAVYKTNNNFAKIHISRLLFLPSQRLIKLDKEMSSDPPAFGNSLITLTELVGRDKNFVCKAIVTNKEYRKIAVLFLGIASCRQICRQLADKDEQAGLMFQNLLSCAKAAIGLMPNKHVFLLHLAREAQSLPRIEFVRDPKYLDKRIQLMDDDKSTCSHHPYGPFYPVSFRATPADTGFIFPQYIRAFLTLFEMEERTDIVISTLVEVFSSKIRDDGYVYRWINEPNMEQDFRYMNTAVLHKLAEILFQFLEEAIPGIFHQDERIVDKLFKLFVVTMASVVKSMERELEKQIEEDDEDVVVILGHENLDTEKEVREITLKMANFGVMFAKMAPQLLQVLSDGGETHEELTETIRLTAVMKRLMGEMKRVPEEWKSLKEMLESDEALNKSIKDLVGDQELPKPGEDASYVNMAELVSLLGGLPYERGHALLVMGRLLMKRNKQLMECYEETFHQLVCEQMKSEDSYVFLAAINCTAEAALAMTHQIVPLVRLFCDTVSSRPKKKGAKKMEPIDERVKMRGFIAAAICRIFDALDTAAPLYIKESVWALLECINDISPIIRACVYTTIGQLFKSTGGHGISACIVQVLDTIEKTLDLDDDQLVRRGAACLMADMMNGAGRDMLTTLEDQLRDINRLLSKLVQSEKDDVVLIHVCRARTEVRAAVKTNFRRGVR
ncbi:hypothetical protein PFISCL1PPCAC_10025, partial [Pristionchus fissidentatus]